MPALAHPPAPSTVSPEMAVSVSAPPGALWTQKGLDAAQVSKLAKSYAAAAGKDAEALASSLGVKVEEAELAGIPAFVLTPPEEAPEKAGKVVFYIHGGGYILGHGIAGISEAALLSAHEGYKVICVDYRMAPEDPFPAAIDDAFAAYKEAVKSFGAENIAVFGTSTGGGMTLILALQAHAAGVPMPAALIAGTPWSDMDKVGDTYATNDGVDNILCTYDGLIATAAQLYAGKEDLKNPFISPVYASDEALKHFPPTLLVSGTRDLFLSNTIRMHKRLLMNDAHAELVVYEAQSHAQYYLTPEAPETAEHYAILGKFLTRTLLKK